MLVPTETLPAVTPAAPQPAPALEPGTDEAEPDVPEATSTPAKATGALKIDNVNTATVAYADNFLIIIFSIFKKIKRAS